MLPRECNRTYEIHPSAPEQLVVDSIEALHFCRLHIARAHLKRACRQLPVRKEQCTMQSNNTSAALTFFLMRFLRSIGGF